MLWSELLAVVPVTIHIPLRSVPDLLTTELIVETGRIVARELTTRFGLPRPRLALSGLNPHAGEGGALGSEDDAVIRPAVSNCGPRASTRSGPCPPTRCSTPGPAQPTTWRSACITTRR